jgi:hypothetical protein
MTHAHASDARSTGGIFYIAVAGLPTTFDDINDWAMALRQDHPHMLGLRGFIDLSRLGATKPPRIAYIRDFVGALEPLTGAARNGRCALLVPRPWLRRAQFVETMTRGSRLQFRAYDNTDQALEWLEVRREEPALMLARA